jgi:hypothetical protein
MRRLAIAVLLFLAANPAPAQSPEPAASASAAGAGGEAFAAPHSCLAGTCGAAATMEQIGLENGGGMPSGNLYALAGFAFAPDASGDRASIEQAPTGLAGMVRSGGADLAGSSEAAQATGPATLAHTANLPASPSPVTEEEAPDDGGTPTTQEAKEAFPAYVSISQPFNPAADVFQPFSLVNTIALTVQAGNFNQAAIRQK